MYLPLLPLLLTLTAGLAFWCLAFLLLSNPPGLHPTRLSDTRRPLHISLQPARAPAVYPVPDPVPGAGAGGATVPESNPVSGPRLLQDPITGQAPLPARAPSSATISPLDPAFQIPENPASTTGAARLTDQALTPSTGTTSSAEIPPAAPSSPETLSRDALDQAISGNLVYPPLARKRGISGVSLWRIGISAAGALESLQLVTGSGSGLLDDAAERALRSSFPLAGSPGSPVTLEYRITFKIK